MLLALNALRWRIYHVDKILKKGMKENISYERRDYEVVVDAPQSKTIMKKILNY